MYVNGNRRSSLGFIHHSQKTLKQQGRHLDNFIEFKTHFEKFI